MYIRPFYNIVLHLFSINVIAITLEILQNSTERLKWNGIIQFIHVSKSLEFLLKDMYVFCCCDTAVNIHIYILVLSCKISIWWISVSGITGSKSICVLIQIAIVGKEEFSSTSQGFFWQKGKIRSIYMPPWAKEWIRAWGSPEGEGNSQDDKKCRYLVSRCLPCHTDVLLRQNLYLIIPFILVNTRNSDSFR